MGIKEEIMVKLKRKLVLLLSAILAVSIAVSLCAVTAFAAGGTDKFDGQGALRRRYLSKSCCRTKAFCKLPLTRT